MISMRMLAMPVLCIALSGAAVAQTDSLPFGAAPHMMTKYKNADGKCDMMVFVGVEFSNYDGNDHATLAREAALRFADPAQIRVNSDGDQIVWVRHIRNLPRLIAFLKAKKEQVNFRRILDMPPELIGAGRDEQFDEIDDSGIESYHSLDRTC